MRERDGRSPAFQLIKKEKGAENTYYRLNTNFKGSTNKSPNKKTIR